MKNLSKEFFIKYRHIFLCLFLVVSTMAVYWQITYHEFVDYDDPNYVTENSHVQPGLKLEGILWAFTTTHTGYWHPLTWLSIMLDCQLFGMNPGRHHLTSLLFHVANTLLLFLVFRKMTGVLWQSAFIAALFALHPLHVESVAWVAERKDVLYTFFWMLALWSYVRYVQRPGVIRILPALLFFALGLMAKPMMVTLPCVLLLLDYWPLGRLNNASSEVTGGIRKKSIALHLILEKTPFFILAAITGVATIIATKHKGALSSLDALPLGARIAGALVSYASYIVKMIWPAKMAVLYPLPAMVPFWKVAVSCLLLVSISFLAFRAVKKTPYFAVGWLWYLGTLVPVIGLVQAGAQSMADRYTYVPLTGLFIVIAWGVPELMAKWQHVRIGLITIAAVYLSIMITATWKQIGYWENSLTLFEHTLKCTSNNYTIHNNLGVALEKRGRLEDAIDHYLQALQIKPDYAIAHNNLGLTLEKKDQTDEAIKHYFQALRIKPDDEKAHYNLGNALIKKGRIKSAITHYAEALRIKPDYSNVHLNLANALAELGRTPEAIVHYSEALLLMPNNSNAHYNFGLMLAKQGKLTEAINHFSKAAQLDPENRAARNNLEKAISTRDKIISTINNINRELKLYPENPGLYYNLGNLYNSIGELKHAVIHYKKALQIQPEFPEVLSNLAIVYTTQGDYDQALPLFKQVIEILPGHAGTYYNIACIYALQHKIEESISWLKDAIKRGYNNWELIKTDKDLRNIRGALDYKELIKNH